MVATPASTVHRSPMFHARGPVTGAYWLLTILLFGVAAQVAAHAPVDPAVGSVERILYIHLPVAVNALLAALVVFAASLAHLGSRHLAWDDLAVAAARVTLLHATALLATGMIWSRFAWGHWWVWSPRLNFSLLLWLLYAVYLGIRPILGRPQRRALVCAIYGVVAFLDVPLVYISMRLLPDVHPAGVSLSPPVQRALLLWFIPTTMLSGALIHAQFSRARRVSLQPQGPRP